MSHEAVAVWFGILVLILIEVGQITPPIGLNVYVINSMAKDVPMTDTFRGIVPFFLSDLVRIAIIILVPATTTWLAGSELKVWQAKSDHGGPAAKRHRRGRRYRRPVRRQCADRAGPQGARLRAGARTGRSRRRRVRHAEQRAAFAAGRPGRQRWSNGARGSAPARIISGTTGRRSRRCRWRTPPAGTRPSACTAPTSSSSWPRRCPQGVVHTGHRVTGFAQEGDIARVIFENGATPKATS